MNNNKIFPILALILGIAEITLVLLSWLITAAIPELTIRSLLSSEGVRWFFAHFTENLASPWLVWLLLLSLAYGSLRHSGLLKAIRTIHTLDYPKRFALRLVAMELFLFIGIILSLTIAPHAVLLSITGDLFPSSFSVSIIPITCFMSCVCSASYGMMSGSLRSLQAVFYCLTIGITYTKPLWLLYILFVQLYCSMTFVFRF